MTATHKPPTETQPAQQPAQLAIEERAAAVAAALAKFAKAHTDRDAMPDGAAYDVDIAMAATVNGQPLAAEVTADVTVGHAQTRASSVGPDQNHVIAAILAKLNTRTRNKILHDLPAEFAAAGELPEVDPEAIEDVKAFRKALRAEVSQDVKGSVTATVTATIE